MANIQFVDINDEPIGAGTKEEALEQGVRNRVVRVILINSAGEVLMHQRAEHLMSNPGKWSTVAGHVDEGETYEQAAIRELQEEVGVTGVSLTEIGYYYSEEFAEMHGRKSFARVYTGKYDGEVVPNPAEVAQTRWVSKSEIDAWIEDDPKGELGSGFIRAYKFVRKLL
jgi:16S rRNA (adenine1518-N6/adenine1519-N6)-dimethyltransferase